ncbi:MAG TPA: tRNA (adenosine(37)-N6)-threonylcarbamoyltransferase complex dimerization subunit type 1 TsaB [Myxococcota bacterium]|nr:tRNA (adenosine(37)-N6)-threonylcarbamoyltransferase complex dimerization subunit type 1 TsaB [Myxococcota bacterium]
MRARQGAAPLLLAIESAVRPGVALLRGDDACARRECAHPAAQTLLPAIADLLAEAGVALADVEAFAISIGPGSFTGLRVGLATLKGLAFGSGLPAVAVPTLAALAADAPPGEGAVVAALDARRGEVYAAAFDPKAGHALAWLPEGVYRAAALADALPLPCRVVGEGAAIAAGALRARGAGVLLHPECAPHAEAVGRLAQRMLARGEGVDPASLVPRYVRRAEAEVRRTGERVEPGAVG